MTAHQRDSDGSIGNPVPAAIVTGSFSAGGSASCVTDPSGSFTLTSGTIRNTDTTKVAVTNVTGPLMTYNASQNTLTEVVITRP